MPDYNYKEFSSGEYDLNASAGPQVGDKAPDFLLRDSLGQPRRLLDFKGDFLVLEIGSITCPLFQTRRPLMEALGKQGHNIENAVLYVREAHPGADIPAHGTLADKVACARRLTGEDGESRLVLVDDLDGAAHRAYGGLPNSVFVINRNGCVVFRSDWNDPRATTAALDALSTGRPLRGRSYFRPAHPSVALRTLRRAGSGSGRDFLRSFPNLVWNNLIRRNLRTLLGRPTVTSADMVC